MNVESKMMNEGMMRGLRISLDELDDIWRRVSRDWAETKSVWKDSRSGDFEEQYWSILEERIMAVQSELGNLEEVISNARRELR